MDAGAGTTGEEGDENRGGPSHPRQAEPVTVTDVEETPVPAAGLEAQASPMASPPTADTTSGAPCPQAMHQPGAEALAGRAAAGRPTKHGN